MTITFLDTPGVPLASKTDVIDFVATDALAFISVAFAGRVTETAYQDGAFLWPYLSSTKNGNAYALVRTGGWPSTPTVSVEERAVAPTTLWTTLYECDLRTLPNTTIQGTKATTYKDFTLDGQPWYFHAGGGATLSVQNTFGLTGTTESEMVDGNPYTGLHVGLKVYGISGYDPNKHTAVQVRFYGNAFAGNTRVGVSMWSGAETFGYGPGNNATILVRDTTNNTVFYRRAQAGVQMTHTVMDRAPFDTQDEWVFGVQATPWGGNAQDGIADKNYRTLSFQRDVGQSVMPSPENMQPFASYNGLGTAESSNYKMGFYFGVTTGTANFTMRHIRVLQKPVVDV